MPAAAMPAWVPSQQHQQATMNGLPSEFSLVPRIFIFSQFPSFLPKECAGAYNYSYCCLQPSQKNETHRVRESKRQQKRAAGAAMGYSFKCVATGRGASAAKEGGAGGYGR